MTTVYYLDWDSPDDGVRGRASELFHEFHYDPPETLSRSDFDELYEEITEVGTDDFEQLFAEWNRGSGHESREFLEQKVRSLSVGDLAELDGTYYACKPIGWQELQLVDE